MLPTQIRESFDIDMIVVFAVFQRLCFNSETAMGERNDRSNNVPVELT